MTIEELKAAIAQDQKQAMYQGLLSAGLHTLGQAPTPYRQSPMQGIAKGMLSGLGDYSTLLQQSGDRRAKQAQMEILIAEESRKKAGEDAEVLKQNRVQEIMAGVPRTMPPTATEIGGWRPPSDVFKDQALGLANVDPVLAAKYAGMFKDFKPERTVNVPGYGPISEQYAHQYLPKDDKAQRMTTIKLNVGPDGKSTPGKIHEWGYDPYTQTVGKYIGEATPAGVGAFGPGGGMVTMTPYIDEATGNPLVVSRGGELRPATTTKETKPIPKATTADIEFSRAFNSASAIIDELKTAFKGSSSELPTGAGSRIVGYPMRKAEAFLQTNPKLAALDSLSSATLSKLSRALGEVGVLTDQDIARAAKAVPTINDTPMVREQKFKQLEGLLKEIHDRGRRNIPTGINIGKDPLGIR